MLAGSALAHVLQRADMPTARSAGQKPMMVPVLDVSATSMAGWGRELAAWQNEVNTDQRQVDWQFTTDDARCPPLPAQTP
jgi:hypothetical protein